MFKLKAIGTRKKQLFRSIAAAVSASADGSFDHDSIAVDMGDSAELEAELGLARYVSELAASAR